MAEEPTSNTAPAPATETTAPVVEATPAASTEAVTTTAPEAAPAAETQTTVLAEALDKPTETTPTESKPAEGDKPAVEAKPAEGDKPAETKPAEETKAPDGQSDEPAPPPTYEPFTMPENVKLDAERLTKFTEILSGLETDGKVSHELMQQFGQKAVDFHIQEVTKTMDDYTKFLQTSWERQKTQWKDDFVKDPEIGGNRMDTSVNAARDFIRTHGGTPEQQKELRDVLDSSGLGNHRALIRLMAKANSVMAEGQPLKANQPVTQTSKLQKMYGNSPLTTQL